LIGIDSNRHENCSKLIDIRFFLILIAKDLCVKPIDYKSDDFKHIVTARESPKLAEKVPSLIAIR